MQLLGTSPAMQAALRMYSALAMLASIEAEDGEGSLAAGQCAIALGTALQFKRAALELSRLERLGTALLPGSTQVGH